MSPTSVIVLIMGTSSQLWWLFRNGTERNGTTVCTEQEREGLQTVTRRTIRSILQGCQVLRMSMSEITYDVLKWQARLVA